MFKLKEDAMAETKIAFFGGGDKVRRGVLTTLTAVILLFSSFTFSSCKSCNKEDKGKESIGGDGNADDKSSDKGGSPALSAEEKKEDIARKLAVALHSIEVASRSASTVLREAYKTPSDFYAEINWINYWNVCGCSCWSSMVVVISRAYVSRDDYRMNDCDGNAIDYYGFLNGDPRLDGMSFLAGEGGGYDDLSGPEKDDTKKQLKEQQEKSKDLHKQADAHIKNIRNKTLPLPVPPLQVYKGARDENGCPIQRDATPAAADWKYETPAETAVRRKKFLESWDALIEAVGKAYTDTKAVFDDVDAQNDGWTLIDILHD
jgi:hypothetical protein